MDKSVFFGPWPHQLLSTLAVLVSMSCASTQDRARVQADIELKIEGMVLVNRTGAYVSAARVLVPNTGRFVSCGNIGPGAVCATGFPELGYSGNPIELTWSQGGAIYSTGMLELRLSEPILSAGKAQVRLTILGEDLAAAELVPLQE